MKNIATVLLLSLICTTTFCQVKVDDSFEFQSDPDKKYSLYIPSGYSEATPHNVLLALHPFNTSRWDSESWRDTLTTCAEANNVILVCPDGGADGQIDDPIDTSFTTAILDSVENWYNIDDRKIYVMGFSWGGKTTYTYGLSHANRFAGFMPVGAAVTLAEIPMTWQANADGKPFYIIHGGDDSPNTRFFPLRDAMINNGAVVADSLLSGVGHTIDFAGRNEMLGIV